MAGLVSKDGGNFRIDVVSTFCPECEALPQLS